MNPQVQREDCPVVPQSGHRTRTQGSKRTISWPVQAYNHGPHTSLPIMYSQFSQILPLCQHWKLTSLKPYKNNYQLDQWDDMTHCTPIQVLASTKKREAKKESVVGSTRDTSVSISGNLEITSLKTHLLLSRGSSGRPSTLPSIFLCFSLPTVQGFPPHGDTWGEHAQRLTPLWTDSA